MFQFENFSDFLSMSGHGVYVWICYGVTLSVLLYLFVQPKLREKKYLQNLRKQAARQQLRKGNVPEAHD